MGKFSFNFSSDGYSLKQQLFIRTQHLDSLAREFNKIMLLPQDKRELWLDDNADFLNELLDHFMEDSMLAFDGVDLDTDTMALSVEFIEKLRNTMAALRTISRENEHLVD